MEPTSEQKEKNRRNKIRILNLLSAVIILIAVGWGVSVFFHFGKSIYTDDAQVEAYINPVNTRIPGYIKSIGFGEHQRVHKGDTLLVLDDREFRIQAEQAKALLLDAMAARDVAASGSEVASNSVNVSGANIEELKARLTNQEVNFKRYERLLAQDAVTKYQYDQMKTELDAMRAHYQALEAQEKGSVFTARESGHRIMSAEANIARARAMLDMANLNLSYTVIRAPYDGVVGRKTIEEGQLLQAGQPALTIVRGDGKWITANYTEDQIERLHVGQVVSIRIDALGNKKFTGRVAAISEATGSRYSAIPVDNSTGNFVKVEQRIPVRIDFTENNPSSDVAMLRAGMNVEIRAAR